MSIMNSFIYDIFEKIATESSKLVRYSKKHTLSFNPLKMAGDMKGMEKMLKPALEKFMNDSGFVKKAELEELKKRVAELEKKVGY
jgi:hypothetical protein